ncbi:MAG TPA: phosphopantetheine-binding protein, partial [Gemmatimonadales bacterium]|nr:phosphopantetheine-binding protein [Gemmatimonadales bacterium]
YYVAANGTAPTDLELRRLLRSSLPEVMIPSAFVRLSAIPRTTNGKVDRKALPATADSTDETAGFVAPRNAIEAAVAGVWSEVLGRSRIGVEDSFFDLGGHSLLATQVVGRLSALFKVQLPLRVFFETPTVAGIADALPRHEPKAGRVAATARILQEIARMPEAERRARGAQIRKPDPIEAQ